MQYHGVVVLANGTGKFLNNLIQQIALKINYLNKS